MKKAFALMGLCVLCACSTQPKEYTFDWRPIISGVEIINWKPLTTLRLYEKLKVSPDASSIRITIVYKDSSLGNRTDTYYFDDAKFYGVDNTEEHRLVYVFYTNGTEREFFKVEYLSPNSYFINWNSSTFPIK